MINPTRLVRLSNVISASRGRMLSTKLEPSQGVPPLANPKIYNVPLRAATMDDLMEPYGSWKQAYEAENKRANFAVLRGILCFTFASLVFCYSGVTDGIYMPNLDNIMEETESFHVDKEDRVTV